jgi:signal transduction histidine kinase
MRAALVSEPSVGAAVRETPTWPVVLTLAASVTVVLAALATVTGLDTPTIPGTDPAILEWFAVTRDLGLLKGTVAALSVCVLVSGWNDVDRRRTGASGTTVSAALLAAGWSALPVSMWSGDPAARGGAFVVAALIPVALAHLVHSVIAGSVALPLGRWVTPARRRAAWTTAYLVVVVLAAVHVLTHDPFREARCMTNCEAVTPWIGVPALAPATDWALRGVASMAAVLAGGTGAVALVRAATVPLRLTGLAALSAGSVELVWALGSMAGAVVGPLPFEGPDLLAARLLPQAAVAATAAVLLVVYARHRLRLRRMAREIVAVTPPNGVREILALRLEDPDARVVYAVEDDGLWVDESGAPVAKDGDPTHQVAVVSREGRSIARVRFATGRAHVADLEDALGPAAVLALEAERTRAELLLRLGALKDLRRRVVEESDAARRRAERDLHDGAQHLLLAATFSIQEGLQDARSSGDALATARLERALADVTAIAADLRAVAHGMYPVLLGDAGLVPALEGLARESAGRISIDSDPVGRLDPSIELTIYEACAIATRGTGQDELSMSLRREGEGLRLHLAGAHLPLTALEPLRDRVAALGGTMVTTTGSTVMEVPCA